MHQAVIDQGETETGCTVHAVTEAVDGGPIVVQKAIKVGTLLFTILQVMVYGC